MTDTEYEVLDIRYSVHTTRDARLGPSEPVVQAFADLASVCHFALSRGQSHALGLHDARMLQTEEAAEISRPFGLPFRRGRLHRYRCSGRDRRQSAAVGT